MFITKDEDHGWEMDSIDTRVIGHFTQGIMAARLLNSKKWQPVFYGIITRLLDKVPRGEFLRRVDYFMSIINYTNTIDKYTKLMLPEPSATAAKTIQQYLNGRILSILSQVPPN